MARKTKPGLTYFSHDCDHDDELEYLVAKHGADGYTVFFRLLEKIYKENGYYMKSDQRTLLMFSKKINVDIEKINVIINECIEENLFYNDFFRDFDIITSKSIQERYIDAINRRKEAVFIEQYLLIEKEDVNNSLKNVDIIYQNVNAGTQSKVNNIIVNKSKLKHSFKESPYFDFNLFKLEIGITFQKYDLKYYHDKLKVHGDSYQYENWLVAAEKWILNDVKEKKAVLKSAPSINEPVDTTNIDNAKSLWNKVMVDINKETSKEEYQNYLDLVIIRFEESFLILKASNKEIVEKLNPKLLNKLTEKHFGEITIRILTKNI